MSYLICYIFHEPSAAAYPKGAEPLKLTYDGLKNENEWTEAGIALPRFDISKMCGKTFLNPRWVHFGAGNIFRGYIAMLQQLLLEAGKAETGIIAVAPYDDEIINRVYKPYDNLALQVLMNADGSFEKNVAAAVSEGLASGSVFDWTRLNQIFRNPGLQMVSFTITEKGYNLYNTDGTYRPDVQEDITAYQLHPQHVMSQAAALLYTRFKSGKFPLSLVSMDNCAHNGDKLRDTILTIAREWVERKLVEEKFLAYLSDARDIAFPLSMIDKITPRPSKRVQEALIKIGFEANEIMETAKHTFIAPFVNAERPQYLVIEDRFPNGRPPLEAAGVYFTDRETVVKAERMKVTTCLNPLHTALAVFGCLLGYTLIADEMKDPYLGRLVRQIGYDEGMPVVTDPGILKPEAFIAEVIGQRLPNPNIPDTPQRIATDTSQKVGVRFGETIKAYIRQNRDINQLKFIPLVIAAWCRYLLGIDDNGDPMPLSPDPLLEHLTAQVAGITLGAPQPEKLRPILSDTSIFGISLYDAGLGTRIENYFSELTACEGAVYQTLQKYLPLTGDN
jgi:fructuronate reductase